MAKILSPEWRAENWKERGKDAAKMAAFILAVVLVQLAATYYRHGTIFPELSNPDQSSARKHR